MQEIFYQPATVLAQRIRKREMSVREIMQAHLARIEAVNPLVNALITVEPELALKAADDADAILAKGQAHGLLFGLPVAHKDSYLTRGIRTTFGSRIYEHNVPTRDSAVVARQRKAGAIIVGKSNVPEFNAGSHTFNAIFCVTRNPYLTSVSAGGSSGGSAAALASGMVALADGSDMGGSLRNPASFCNVVGLRPSLGRVPMSPSNHPFTLLSVGGPMGRCVADVALLLEVLAGEDAEDPFAVDAPLGSFFPLKPCDPNGLRIAVSSTVGGLPFEPDVLRAVQTGVATIRDMGCEIEEREPDFDGADTAFEVFRALAFATNYGQLDTSQRATIKDTVRWNIDLGLALTGGQIAAAGRAHGQMFNRMQKLLSDFDFLVAPVSQVTPFAVEQEYPMQIAGTEMPDYIRWMRSCSRLTVTGHPCIALPCGFTEEGKPVGIQIVGRYRQEAALLSFARAFEEALPTGKRRPAFTP